MSNFSEKAFEDAIKATANDGYEAFCRYIIGSEDKILEAVRIKLFLEGRIKGVDKLVATVNNAGLSENLAEFLGSLMQVVFSIGYNAHRDSLK